MFRQVRTVADSRDLVISLCKPMDLDALITDRRRTIAFYACFICPFFFHTFSLYTLFYYRHDIIPFLKCVAVWGAAGQCSFKTISAYIHQKRFREIFDSITSMQVECENDPVVYEMYLKWSKRLSVILKMLTYSIASNIVLFPLYLLVGIILNGRQYVFVLVIPGLSGDPAAGFPDYEIQLTFQLVTLSIGVFEVIALDGLFVYFVLNGASMGDSLIVTIQRMSMDVEKTTHQVTGRAIKQIIRQHWKYLEFINGIDDIYNGIFLMQFGSFVLSVSVSLYVARVSDYFAIYGLVIASLFQLFMYNALGSIIEAKNQDIAEELYNSNWLQMGKSNRKMLLLMLQRAKTIPTLSVGHMAPLNLETGMRMNKTLYSYFLLLKDAFN